MNKDIITRDDWESFIECYILVVVLGAMIICTIQFLGYIFSFPGSYFWTPGEKFCYFFSNCPFFQFLTDPLDTDHVLKREGLATGGAPFFVWTIILLLLVYGQVGVGFLMLIVLVTLKVAMLGMVYQTVTTKNANS